MKQGGVNPVSNTTGPNNKNFNGVEIKNVPGEASAGTKCHH